MSTQTKSPNRTYFAVFIWLIVFTAVELLAVYSHAPHRVVVAVLLATAVGKAFLIALFFMHLKFENRWVWILPGIPLFFIIFFVCGLFPDIAWHLAGNF
jgi:cytochrome c oxidase subunit 4